MFLITQRNTEFRQSQARPLNRIDQVFNQQLFPRLTWVDGWITDQLCQFFWVGDLNHILYPIIATDHVQNLQSSLVKEVQEIGQWQLFRGLSEADDFLILLGHQLNDLGITKVSLHCIHPNLWNLQNSDFKLDPSTHLCHWRPGNVRAMCLRPAHNLGFSRGSISLPYSVLPPQMLSDQRTAVGSGTLARVSKIFPLVLLSLFF